MQSKKELPNLMSRCSRFNKCDIPKCPLDFEMIKRVRYIDEPVCGMPKSYLKRKADKYLDKLPWLETFHNANVRKRKNASICHLKNEANLTTTAYQ